MKFLTDSGEGRGDFPLGPVNQVAHLRAAATGGSSFVSESSRRSRQTPRLFVPKESEAQTFIVAKVGKDSLNEMR
jgi:hypothetical protein